MKILFGKEHYGKDTSECPTGFLVWIIESYEKAEWLLIQACKSEISARLKLDWTMPVHPDEALRKYVNDLKRENARLLSGKIMFEKICWLYGIEEIDYAKYFRSPQWLDNDIEEANAEGWRKMPYQHFYRPEFQAKIQEEREQGKAYLQRLDEVSPEFREYVKKNPDKAKTFIGNFVKCETIADLNNLLKSIKPQNT